MITPIQAECALAVAEAGSFRRAAVVTGIPQPVLSAHVRRLEKVLGVRLFERGSGAATSITAAGSRLVPNLAAFVESEVAIERVVAEISGRERPPIRVGGDRLGIRHLLTPALTTTREHVPDLVVEVVGEDTSRVVDQLVRGTLDIGFGARLATDASPPHIEEIELSRSPLVLFCAVGNPLAERATVRFAELVGEVVIVVQSSLGIRLVDLFGADLVVRPTTWSAQDVDVALHLVAQDVGVAPLHLDVGVLADERVVAVRLEPELDVSVTLMRAAGRARAFEAELLWQLLQDPPER